MLMTETKRKYHFYSLIQEKQLKEFKGKASDYSILKYFDLIIDRLPDQYTESKDKTGFWTLTQKGIDFLKGKIDCEDFVITLGKQVIQRSERKIKIHDLDINLIDLRQERKPF